MADMKQIHDFAVKWCDKFKNKNINYIELVDHYMADDCAALGFKMDCGKAFSKKYGNAVNNHEALGRIIDDVTDIPLLGAAIYSQWRYFNHWAYTGAEILKPQNRAWFILALSRLAVLSNEKRGKKLMQNYISKERIEKGWSYDKKYCITDETGMRYLLRISDLEEYDLKQSEFNQMKLVASLGIPMCQPIEFGTCEEGVYSIQSWIEGEDAEQVMPTYSDTEQYVYGLEAGHILRKIHSIPAPATQEDWETRFNRKMDHKIKQYSESPIQYENGQALIDYIQENRHLLKGRPQVYQHGDYHIGNMMIDRSGALQIIDFNRNDYGDPWEEFNRIVWSAQSAPLFASGMVNGYFDGAVPMEFWKLLALYIASNTLSSIYWAIPFGQEEVNTMLNQARDILDWYDNMQNPVPTWYCRN